MAHCPKGIFNVKTYSKIIIRDIYPGIDWIIYTDKNNVFKYDFIVHSGADPYKIKLLYEGRGQFNIKENQIVLKNKTGSVSEGKLVCYQGEVSNTIKSNYSFIKNKMLLYDGEGNIQTGKKKFDVGKNLFSCEVSIELGNYDTTKTLVIDPEINWSTYYGGNLSEGPMDMECDLSGNVFVTGYTHSSNFPTQTWSTAYFQTYSADWDGYILQFTNSGVLKWSTIYGGTNNEEPNSICLDALNNIYIVGRTASSDFPVQISAFAYNQIYAGSEDGFIVKFNSAGIRTWGTFFGGNSTDYSYNVICDNANNVFMTGQTQSSSGFPILAWGGAYFDNTLGSVDAYLVKFNSIGTLVWSTFIGGSQGEYANTLVFDTFGNIYVSGLTTSTDFPIFMKPGAYNQVTYGGGTSDGFILKFDNTGILKWSTYYGGGGSEEVSTLMTDNINNVYLTGNTDSPDLPLKFLAGAFNKSVLIGADEDIFILKFEESNDLKWATYFGGSGTDEVSGSINSDNLEMDNCGNIYLSFETESSDIFTKGTSACGQYFDSTNLDRRSFLLKFNKDGIIFWATYFAGTGPSWVPGVPLRQVIEVDQNGSIFVAGECWTMSGHPLFNPFGGAYYDNTSSGYDDTYFTKFIKEPSFYTTTQNNVSKCDSCDGLLTIIANCNPTVYNYVWSTGQQTLNTTDTSNTISGLCEGNYSITVSNGDCASEVLYFTLSPPSSPELNAIISNPSCIGMLDGTATVIVIGGAYPYDYSWSNTQTTAIASGLGSGTYTVNVIDSLNCSNTLSMILVDPPIKDTLKIYGILCDQSQETSLILPSDAQPTFQWYFDSLPIIGQNSDVYITDYFNLSSISATWFLNGCNYLTTTVETNQFPIVSKKYIPNVFSPNNDSYNNLFYPFTFSNSLDAYEAQFLFEEFNMKIFNRWGNLIFESNDPILGWDGRNTQQEYVSDGVYYVMISCKSLCQENTDSFLYNGIIQLVR